MLLNVKRSRGLDISGAGSAREAGADAGHEPGQARLGDAVVDVAAVALGGEEAAALHEAEVAGGDGFDDSLPEPRHRLRGDDGAYADATTTEYRNS